METLTLRQTVIAGQRYADDYQVRWRGLPVGRIVLGSGAPHDRPPWSWSCHLPAARRATTTGAALPISPTPRRSSRRPGRIRSGLTEAEIAHARRVAEISAEAVAKYDRKGRA